MNTQVNMSCENYENIQHSQPNTPSQKATQSQSTFDENSFDDLDDNATVQARCLAGGVAGTMEHLVIYGLDSLKTNQQTRQVTTSNFRSQLSQITENGVSKAFRGVSTNMGFVFLAHAAQFPAIEYTRDNLEQRKWLLSSFLAGAAGGVLHDVIIFGVRNFNLLVI